MLYSYYVGVDLGQKQDYTAVAVLEEPCWVADWMATPSNHNYELGLYDLDKLGPGWASPAKMQPAVLEQLRALNYYEGRPLASPLSLRHLERFALGTPYPKIVERVKAMLATPPLLDRPTALLVDQTGVGQGVVDMLVQAGLNPTPITIHGGDRVNRAPDGALRVPKRDLIGAAQVLLQSERLKIARALPEAGTLRQELQNFRMKIDPKTAHDSYSHWREGVHDDLVLSVSLAAWYRQWWNTNLDVANSRRR